MSHVDPVLEEVWRVKDELNARHHTMADLMALLREKRTQFEKDTLANQAGSPTAKPAQQTRHLLKAMGL